MTNSFLYFIRIKILFVLFCFFSVAFASENISDWSCWDKVVLSKDEEDAALRLAAEMPIDKAVGQLIFIGAPGDMETYSNSEALKDVVKKLNIGNIFLSSYHYNPDKTIDDYAKLSKATSYHDYLKNLYKESGLPPPILAIDYESQDTSSLKHLPIAHPINALTLASTADSELVRNAGIYFGKQLKLLGIDAIFGPNLDVDGSPQGSPRPLIGSRVFGDNAKDVYSVGANYLYGLKCNKVVTFLKHYPGYGNITVNPDRETDSAPIVYLDWKDTADQIIPFRNLSEKADGFLTAHIQNEKFDKKLATFSKPIIAQLIRGKTALEFNGQKIDALNYVDGVIVTDDLSDMGVIHKYMSDKYKSYQTENEKPFPEVARLAIEAGHDILLFAHLETEFNKKGELKPRGRNASFKLNDLKRVKESLVANAKKDSVFESRLRESLRRILLLKSRILKRQNNDNSNKSRISLSKWDTSPIKVSDVQDVINKTRSLSSEIYTKAFLKLSGNNADVNSKDIIIACHEERFCAPFRDSSNNNWTINSIKDDKQGFNDFKDFFDRYLRQANKPVLILIATEPKYDHDIIEYISTKTSQFFREARDNIFIILHVTPKSLPSKDEIELSGFNILGNFSRNIMALHADIEFIEGYKPSVANVPIAIPALDLISKTEWELPVKERLPQVETNHLDLNSLVACHKENEDIRAEYEKNCETNSVTSENSGLITKKCEQLTIGLTVIWLVAFLSCFITIFIQLGKAKKFELLSFLLYFLFNSALSYAPEKLQSDKLKEYFEKKLNIFIEKEKLNDRKIRTRYELIFIMTQIMLFITCLILFVIFGDYIRDYFFGKK